MHFVNHNNLRGCKSINGVNQEWDFPKIYWKLNNRRSWNWNARTPLPVGGRPNEVSMYFHYLFKEGGRLACRVKCWLLYSSIVFMICDWLLRIIQQINKLLLLLTSCDSLLQVDMSNLLDRFNGYYADIPHSRPQALSYLAGDVKKFTRNRFCINIYCVKI